MLERTKRVIARVISASGGFIVNSSAEVRVRNQIQADLKKVLALDVIPAQKIGFFERFDRKKHAQDGFLFHFSPNGSDLDLLGVIEQGRIKSLKMLADKGGWKSVDPEMFDFAWVSFRRLAGIKTRHGFANRVLPAK